MSYGGVLEDESTVYLYGVLILRVLDCIVTISFCVYLVLWLFELILQCVGEFMWGCFDNCFGVLVICVLVFTVFFIVCTAFLYCFILYIYFYLFCLY